MIQKLLCKYTVIFGLLKHLVILNTGFVYYLKVNEYMYTSLKACPHLNWIKTGLLTKLIDLHPIRIQCALIASVLLKQGSGFTPIYC